MDGRITEKPGSVIASRKAMGFRIPGLNQELNSTDQYGLTGTAS
jgi:hypothetical protein